ncbi:hypothetical protein ACR80S_06565 [Halomonas sp. MA07-2]|uniref:hypothetical protein n=1 Tax=unclassified Halomonas TaxID=2609666 RepID=UPI003EF06C7C
MTLIAVHHDPGADATSLRDRVLDEALRQAESQGWEAVRLTEVATQLEVPMAAVLAEFRDLDAVANAWFQRGLEALLADKPDGFDHWPEAQRLEHCLLAWLDALGAHRRVTVAMLRTKAHLPHLHTWVPMVFDLSRTVQWWREAARLPSPYGTRRAQIEELSLTGLFLATLAVWTGDASEGQARTRRFLERRLACGSRWMRWVPCGHAHHRDHEVALQI